MTVRARYSVAAAMSSTSAEDRDLGNVKYEVVTDMPDKGGTWKTTLVGSATDVQLYMDNITTVKLIIIKTYPTDPNQVPGDILIRKNSISGEQILIRPLPSGKEGHFLLSTDSVTSIYASNAGTVSMDLTLTVAGS